MYSKKLRNLTQYTKNTAGLVALVSALFLSACGIKGDLYQTPSVETVEKSSQDQSLLGPNKTSEPAQGLSEENPSASRQE